MKLKDLDRAHPEHRAAVAMIAQKFGLENVHIEAVRNIPKPSVKQLRDEKRRAIAAEIHVENLGSAGGRVSSPSSRRGGESPPASPLSERRGGD